MKPQTFIKHDRALDVCFYIIGMHKNYDSVELYGVWYNLGFNNAFPIIRENIVIKNEDLKNWSEATDRRASSGRNWIWRKTCA